MVNKLSNKTLIIVFVVLLAIVVIFMIHDSEHGERSFRSNLVNIDTSNVTSIDIYPKATNHKVVRIFKEGKEWKVTLSDKKTALVPMSKIRGLFTQLLAFKPIGVAAQKKDKWHEFQVDSAGTRIKVYEGNKKTLDMTIGKFTYHRPRSMSTYVRVANDNNVYEVMGFMSYEFNHNANYYRDDRVINDNSANWNKLTFTYPADSSYQLVKVKNKWEVNGKQADSAKVANYLNTVSRITDPNFIDNPSSSLLRKVKYNLTIQTSSLGAITVSAYADTSNIAVNSTQFPDTYFDGKKADFWKRIYVGKEKFFKNKKKK